MSDMEDSETESMRSGDELLDDATVDEHAKQLELLQKKDPEFYQYLKDFDKDLLDFKDEENDEIDDEPANSDSDSESLAQIQETKANIKPITTAMVDGWIQEIKSGSRTLGATRSLLRAFRSACHYGDDSQNPAKLSIISSSVFNKIMVFVLTSMDGILRALLEAPASGGKKEMVEELKLGPKWRSYGSLVRVYLGNAYHVLNQMTDEQMIGFTIKRVRASCVFLAAFPSLLRKYIKVILHTWSSTRGITSVVSFLFLRDLCVRLGSDCLDTCLRGVYKSYVTNCKLSKSVGISKLQHIQFLGNCVTELCGVDPPAAYQLAFLFIRQLATVLRGALTEKGPKASEKGKKGGKKDRNNNNSNNNIPSKKQVEKAYQRVYEWQFIFCLELWTSIICHHASDPSFSQLSYPLSQLLLGVAGLVPTVKYFPVRLRCVKMLNRIAEATGGFVPVASVLMDMLEMKELRGMPAGGVGKAVNLMTIKQVDKNTVKTRSFQEACIYSVVDELAEHLAQWSYSITFFELSFIPLVRLRSFCKTLKAERFRTEIKQLIRQIEANVEFTNRRRVGIGFSPNDPTLETFLEVEKEKGESPLSVFMKSLRERAQLRHNSLVEKSVIIGAGSAAKIPESDEEIDEEEGEAAFSSSWLPDKKKSEVEKEEKKSKKKKRDVEERGDDRNEDDENEEDIVEDLVLSSDEEIDDKDDDEGEMDLLLDEDEEEGIKKKMKSKPKRDFKKRKNVGGTKRKNPKFSKGANKKGGKRLKK